MYLLSYARRQSRRGGGSCTESNLPRAPGIARLPGRKYRPFAESALGNSCTSLQFVLFARAVPIVRKCGLWGQPVQFARMIRTASKGRLFSSRSLRSSHATARRATTTRRPLLYRPTQPPLRDQERSKACRKTWGRPCPSAAQFSRVALFNAG